MFINDTVHSTIYAGELKWVSIYQTNKALYHNSVSANHLAASPLSTSFKRSTYGILPKLLTVAFSFLFFLTFKNLDQGFWTKNWQIIQSVHSRNGIDHNTMNTCRSFLVFLSWRIIYNQISVLLINDCDLNVVCKLTIAHPYIYTIKNVYCNNLNATHFFHKHLFRIHMSQRLCRRKGQS